MEETENHSELYYQNLKRNHVTCLNNYRGKNHSGSSTTEDKTTTAFQKFFGTADFYAEVPTVTKPICFPSPHEMKNSPICS